VTETVSATTLLVLAGVWFLVGVITGAIVMHARERSRQVTETCAWMGRVMAARVVHMSDITEAAERMAQATRRLRAGATPGNEAMLFITWTIERTNLVPSDVEVAHPDERAMLTAWTPKVPS
jgi:hypothetical protein